MVQSSSERGAAGPRPRSLKPGLLKRSRAMPSCATSARRAGETGQHYLKHPVTGGWYDQFDENGTSLVDWIPVSTFYHVLCAVAEAERVLEA